MTRPTHQRSLQVVAAGPIIDSRAAIQYDPALQVHLCLCWRAMKLMNITIACLATILSLYLAELIVRVVFVQPDRIASYYPFGEEISQARLSLKQREFEVDYQYNHFGFRDIDFSSEKSPGEKRIVFFGDSFTEGFGVDASKRFSTLVQNKINATDSSRRVKALNAAQLATQPEHYLQNIARFGLSLKPDLVIVSIFSGNDFMGARHVSMPLTYAVNDAFPGQEPTWIDDLGGALKLEFLRGVIRQQWDGGEVPSKMQRYVRPIRSGKIWDVYFGRSITKSSLASIYQIPLDSFERCTETAEEGVVADTISGRLNPCFVGETVSYYCPSAGATAPNPYYTEEDFTTTAKIVDEIAAVLSSRKIPFLFLVIPDVFDVLPESYTQVLRQFGLPEPPARLSEAQVLKARLLQHLVDHQIAHLDMTKALEAQSPAGYYLFDSHFNPQGHELVADRLVEYLHTNSIAGL